MTYTTQERFTQFLGSNFFKRHLAHIPLDTTGVWEVIGEGDERGYGGSKIGLFSGQLEDIIYMAVADPNFWSWGHGGEITLRTITVIEHDEERTAARLATAEAERKQKIIDQRNTLLAQAAELDKQLAN